MSKAGAVHALTARSSRDMDASDLGRKLQIFAEQFGVRTARHGPGDMSPLGHAANIHIDWCRTQYPGCIAGYNAVKVRLARLGLPGEPAGPNWFKGVENMLAAECAWAILRAEHTRIRELLCLVDGGLKTADWTRPGRPAAALVELIERLQAFEETTHRPKGVVLLEILRGRSAEADKLLDQLELESERSDGLLSQSKAMLKLAESGDIGAARAVEPLLREHGQLMHAHLELEDTLLHSQTALLLTGEEWAAVVSSMSQVMAPRTNATAGPKDDEDG